jgi:hypothetical protein
MRGGVCGAPLWLRPLPSLAFPRCGQVKASTKARRDARRQGLGMRPRGMRPNRGRRRKGRIGHKAKAVQCRNIRAVRLHSTRAERPRNTRVVRPLTTLRPVRRIRLLPTAGTRARRTLARLVLVTATLALRLRDTWVTGSISTVEYRCRIKSGCCTMTPTSIGSLPATSSG